MEEIVLEEAPMSVLRWTAAEETINAEETVAQEADHTRAGWPCGSIRRVHGWWWEEAGQTPIGRGGWQPCD
jgi:hypothetical protein